MAHQFLPYLGETIGCHLQTEDGVQLVAEQLRQHFVAGVTIFTVASAWCGCAPDITQLVLARALAGIGGGLAMTPVTA